MTARRVRFLLRAGVSFALVAFLGWRLAQQGTEGVALASPPWLAAAAALVWLAVTVRVVSFSLLVNRGRRVVTFRQAYYLTLVGAGAGLFLPGGAGDIAKAALGARAYGSPEQVVASSVIDKLTSLASVAALGVAGALVAEEPALAAASGLLLAAAMLPLLAPRIVPWAWVVRVVGGGAEPEALVGAVRTPAPMLATVLAVSTAGWLTTFAVLVACSRAAGADVSAAYIYSVGPLIVVSSLVPISLAGLGLTQLTMAYALARAGVPQPVAISAAFFQLAVNLPPGVLGIALYGMSRHGRADSRPAED